MKADSILATIGNTPHVRVNRLFDPRVEVWFKQERANPGGSIKDRIALAMIEDAEARGILEPGLRHHRADLGQHRDRPRPRLRREGLPPDPDDARVDVDRAPQADDRLRRGARADAARAGHEGRDRPGQRAGGRDPGRLDPDAVREPGEPGRPPPDDRGGDPARLPRRPRLRRHRRRDRRPHHRRRRGPQAALAERSRCTRSSRRSRRCCPAARTRRTRSRGSAPGSSRA